MPLPEHALPFNITQFRLEKYAGQPRSSRAGVSPFIILQLNTDKWHVIQEDLAHIESVLLIVLSHHNVITEHKGDFNLSPKRVAPHETSASYTASHPTAGTNKQSETLNGLV